MTDTPDVNDFIMGGGAKTASFPTVGATIEGTITDQKMQQETAYLTNEPLTWDDGNPRMQPVFTLDTDDRDDAEDDGVRKLYCNWRQKAAIRDAVKEAGADRLEIGGKLTVQYYADGDAEKGLNPPKLYRAKYEPPAAAPPVSVEGW